MNSTHVKYLILIMAGIATGFFFRGFLEKKQAVPIIENKPVTKFDNISKTLWDSTFTLAEIPSSMDGKIQKAYCYKSTNPSPGPLVVSLHTWSGNYEQTDEVAAICVQKNLSYIHPDFRGANQNTDACCSSKALNDIDDAIVFSKKTMNVDTNKIYIIGVSGGGYASLSHFMKSRQKISKYSVWVPVTDLVAWYNQSKIRNSKYADDIMLCTGSAVELNVKNAQERSPVYWEIPDEKLTQTKVMIYTGIYDGIQGSVPITQSINFYNKMLKNLGVKDASVYVSDSEKLNLMEFRQPLGDFGSISDRKICLKKEFGNLKLTVFEGNHEMLSTFAMDELLNEK